MHRAKIGLFILFTAVCFGVQARTYEVALWRGETAQLRIPDEIELGAAPAPLKVREGSIKEVKYRANRHKLVYSSVADKVEWNGWKEGARVVEISAPADMKAGVYKCGMLDIRVVDRVLPPPSEWKYVLDLWQHPWAIARAANVKPFTPEYYKAARPVYETLATAGQKFITATIVDRPWNSQCYDAYGTMVRHIKLADGKWCFDYKVFDEYVEFAKSCGIGPYIACYTLCTWGNVVRWEDEKGEKFSVEAPAGGAAFKEYWGDFLVDFAAHLKAKGWFEITYIAMDERSPKEVKAIADFVREKAPGMKISMAGNRKPSDFKGIEIDCYSQIIYDVDAAFLAEIPERRAKGHFTTHYVCCGPLEPNTFLDSEENEAFWVGYYPAAVGLDGFLRWAWNSWGRFPCDDVTFDGRGAWKQGDVFLAYPDGSPSWRFVKLRQGIVAAEKTRILREQGLFTKELDEAAKEFDYAKLKQKKSTYKALADKTAVLVNRAK